MTALFSHQAKPKFQPNTATTPTGENNRNLLEKDTTLRPATLATIERFKRANWFAQVGKNLIDSGEISVPITIVSSWEKATRQCESDEWDLTLNESTNEFTNRLVRASKEEFRTWNDHVIAVKEVSKPLVEEKMAEAKQKHDLSSAVSDAMRWIVTLTLTEAEYAHVVDSGNHSKLSFWIVNGHFPCGWKGEFPNGNPIIY